MRKYCTIITGRTWRRINEREAESIGPFLIIAQIEIRTVKNIFCFLPIKLKECCAIIIGNKISLLFYIEKFQHIFICSADFGNTDTLIVSDHFLILPDIYPILVCNGIDPILCCYDLL